MTSDDPIALDKHRSADERKAAEFRRTQRDSSDCEMQLRERQETVQTRMIRQPAQTWEDAAEKAEYLISMLAPRAGLRNPRLQQLMTAVFDDFARLSRPKHDA